MRIVDALHAEFPDLTYDVTIKVEHLLAHRRPAGLATPAACWSPARSNRSTTTSWQRLDKQPHRGRFRRTRWRCCAPTGLALNPTFVAFTPWTTRAGYAAFPARRSCDLDLVDHVAPVQYASGC